MDICIIMGVDIYKAESEYVWDKAIEANPELNDKTCVIVPEGLIKHGSDYDNSFKGIPHNYEEIYRGKTDARSIIYDVVDQHDHVGHKPRESLVDDNITVIHWNDNIPANYIEVTGAPITYITSIFTPVLVDRVGVNRISLDDYDMSVGYDKFTIINGQQDGQEVRITIDYKDTTRDYWIFAQIGKHAAIRGGYVDIEHGDANIIVQNILTITDFQDNNDGTAIVTGTLEEGEILTDNPSDYHLSRYAYLDGTSGDIMMNIPEIWVGTRNDGPDHYVYLSLEATSYTPFCTCGMNLSMVPLFAMARDTYLNLPDYVKNVLDAGLSTSIDGHDEGGVFSIPFPTRAPGIADNLADTIGLVEAGLFNLLSLQDYMTLYWVLVAENNRFNVPNTNLGYYQWYVDSDYMSNHFKPNTRTEITYESKSYRWHGILNLFRGLPILLNGGMASVHVNDNLSMIPNFGYKGGWNVAIQPSYMPDSQLLEDPSNVRHFFSWMRGDRYNSDVMRVFPEHYNYNIVTARVSSSGLLIPTKINEVSPFNVYNISGQTNVFFTSNLLDDATYNYKYIIANPMWDQASYYSSGFRIGTIDENFNIVDGLVNSEEHHVYPLVFVTF